MLWEVFSYSFVQKIFSWSFIFPDSLFWCLHSSQINCFTYHSQTGLRKITSVTPAQWCWQPPPTLFPLCGVEGSYRVCLLLLHWVQGWRKLGKDAMSTRKTQPTLCFSSWAHHSCEAGEKGGSSLRTPAHEMRRSTLSLPGIIQKLRHPMPCSELNAKRVSVLHDPTGCYLHCPFGVLDRSEATRALGVVNRT